MKMTKGQLIKLLSEKITENLTKSILEHTKEGLEMKLKEADFDMDDFFFSDAEAAAKADMERHYGDKMVHARLGDKENVKSFLDAQMKANDADVDLHAPHLKSGKERTFNQQLVDFMSKDHRFAELREKDPRGLFDIIGLAAYKYMMDQRRASPFISALQGWVADLDHEFDPTAEDLDDVDPSAYRMLQKFEPIYNNEVKVKKLNEILSILEGEQIARYYPIVFLQGEEADEAMNMLDEQGEEATLRHLLQTYYDQDSLRALDDDRYKGNADHEYREVIDGETYIMNWNYGIPYIGLTEMRMTDAVDFNDDQYKDLYDGVNEGESNKTYEYHINLNERGMFYADVRDANEKSVYSIKIGYGEDEDNNPVENGFMKNLRDISGLEKYLKSLGVISRDSKIVSAYGNMREDMGDGMHLDAGELSDEPSSLESLETINDVSKGYYVVPPKGDDPLWYVVDQDGDPVEGYDTKEEAERAVQNLESNLDPITGAYSQEAPQYGIDFKESRLQRIDRLMNEAFELIKEYNNIGGYPAGAERDPRAPWNISDPEPAKKSPKEVFTLTDSNDECMILHHGGSYYAFYKDGLTREQCESIAIDYIGVPSQVEKDEDGYNMVYDASSYSRPSDLPADAIKDYVNDNYAHMKVGDGLEAWEDGSYDLIRIDQPLARELKSTWANLSVPIS